ncbi:LysR family transcriptional regulator [Nocardia sp. alder85J]|uniref:LysR family transcriptional regulator n=1 Tax=Nocardia sp. alder85J TaxID=2862949 RepID=UPI001CD6E584|nr:LysR family transcriptional regulator [Nocardia sp. alder85J]MCX4096096.1 LysR family transcriptional regulator [Nocardia sp. alder85J]
MDLLQLRYFRTVARTEHLGRAAAQLRVAQPSLSRTIARLETDLGVPLFDRQGRGIRLNRFGAAFLARVDRALGELDDARTELADLAGNNCGSVVVAAENLAVLRTLVAAYLGVYPDVAVRLSQCSPEETANRLLGGTVDLAVLSQRLDRPGVVGRDLITEEVLLAVPPGHRLARRRRVPMSELISEPFVTTGPDYWPRRLLDRLLAPTGQRPVIACEGDDPASLRGLVSIGLGVGLLPAMARQSPGPRVSWLHIDDPDCRRTLSLYWREGAYLPLSARRFRDLATERFAAVEAGRQPAGL